MPTTSSFVRIIDLSLLTNNRRINCGEDEIANKAQELHEGLSQTGFIMLTGHGIPKSIISSVCNHSNNFFESPNPLKEIFLKPKDHVSFDGYNFVSGLQNFKYREYFHFWKNRLICSNSENMSEEFLVLMKNYEDSVNSLKESCNELCTKLFLLLSKALGVQENVINEYHNGLRNKDIPNHTYLASIYYPPVLNPSMVMPKNKGRMGNHTDWDTFTLLFLDPVGGLEAKTVQGNWVPTDPIVDAEGNLSILLLVGDFLEMWSGGLYPATEHRVLIPSEENQKKSRLSLPYFVLPDNSVCVKPLSRTAVDGESSKRDSNNEPVNVGDYFVNHAIEAFNKSHP